MMKCLSSIYLSPIGLAPIPLQASIFTLAIRQPSSRNCSAQTSKIQCATAGLSAQQTVQDMPMAQRQACHAPQHTQTEQYICLFK